MEMEEAIEMVCQEVYGRISMVLEEEGHVSEASPVMLYITSIEGDAPEAVLVVPKLIGKPDDDDPDGSADQQLVANMIYACLSAAKNEFGKPKFVAFVTPSLKMNPDTALAALSEVLGNEVDHNQGFIWELLVLLGIVNDDGTVTMRTMEFQTTEGGKELTGRVDQADWDMDRLDRSVDNAQPLCAMHRFMVEVA